MANNYQSQEGNGALFKNDKGDNPARPDYRGDVTLGGVNYELSAWIKPLKSDPSKRYMSISAKVKQGQPAQQQSASRARPERRDDESDCPF